MGDCILTGHAGASSSGYKEYGVFGIRRNTTSASVSWNRTNDAIGMQAGASVPVSSMFVSGYSDFSKVYPWKGMERVNVGTDVMVKIPKFYYRRYKESDDEIIQISAKAFSNSTLHPAFSHNGKTQDFIYVGAYETSSNNKSVTGATPTVSQTRATMRTNAKAKGTGWSLIDITTLSAIEMLYLVEFANNNSQLCVGRGRADTSSKQNTGSGDSIPNLTGSKASTNDAVCYRGIENFWGNIWEWTDGLNWNNGTYYICNNQSSYADDTTTGYTALSYTGSTSWSGSYIKTLGLDTNNSWCMMPNDCGSTGTGENTYYCDGGWSSTGWRVFGRGGGWVDASLGGLFAFTCSAASSGAYDSIGSRLLYIPA